MGITTREGKGVPLTNSELDANFAEIAAGDALTLSAAKAYAETLVVGLWDDRGNYNASSNTFPTTGGSGIGGAVLKGDIWTISVAGLLGSVPMATRQTIRATVDAPGQVLANWAIGLANTDLEDSITLGVTGRAPSQNAVAAALALKAPVDSPTFTGPVKGITAPMVGLGNVDNTSDTAKPVSTLQATALAGKAALNGDATKNFNLASINNGPVGSIRNKLLNPTFRVNQRQIFNADSSANGRIADGWLNASGSGMGTLCNYGVNTNGPISANGGLTMYAQTANVVKPTLAASDYLSVGTAIEGFDINDMLFGTAQAKSITVSFRAYVAVATTIAIVIRNYNTTRSYVAPVNLTVGNNSYTVTILGETTGTWAPGNDIGLSLFFVFSCGTNYHTNTPNTWLTGNYFGHSSVSNLLDTTSRYVQIADPQLEIGLSATPFSANQYAVELQRCQRYFETGDAPMSYMNWNVQVTAAYGSMSFKVPKRISPAVTCKNWTYYSAGADTGFTPTINRTTTNSFTFVGSSLTSWAGWAPGGTWEASAEL